MIRRLSTIHGHLQRMSSHSSSNGALAEAAITPQLIETFQKGYLSNPQFQLATTVVSNSSPVSELVVKREAIVRNNDQVFSQKMKYKEAKITNQQSTGRCWLFAATNVLRLKVIETLKCDDFQFSQPYLFFWDKFEKANYFLTSMIELAHSPVDDRLVAYLLHAPIGDGGQYDMFINLVDKYGLVPLSAYPESSHSCSSKEMNWLITFQLRQGAQRLREMVVSGASMDAILEEKNRVLESVYRIQCIFFGGAPPTQFDWRFDAEKKKKKRRGKKDKDEKEEDVAEGDAEPDGEEDEAKTAPGGGSVHEFLGVSPRHFVSEIAKVNVADNVSIINDPRNPYGRTYTVDRLGNVVGGRPVLYLNLPIEELKRYAAQTIVGGEPVWFGCDVRKFFHAKMHVMDTAQFDYELTFGVGFSQSKADRLRYGQSLMTHAMVFTAFDGQAERPTRWRVENSWGDKNNKGYALMTDAWFNEFMYQIVVHKDLLTEEHRQALSRDPPVVLPAWDPMGSLASED